jgi:hypothetical protein
VRKSARLDHILPAQLLLQCRLFAIIDTGAEDTRDVSIPIRVSFPMDGSFEDLQRPIWRTDAVGAVNTFIRSSAPISIGAARLASRQIFISPRIEGRGRYTLPGHALGRKTQRPAPGRRAEPSTNNQQGVNDCVMASNTREDGSADANGLTSRNKPLQRSRESPAGSSASPSARAKESQQKSLPFTKGGRLCIFGAVRKSLRFLL